MQRGMEATNYGGEGMVVIADDDASNREVEWPRQVLGRVQAYALESGFYVQRMIPRLHSYHLPDAPELRSCNLLFKALEDREDPQDEQRYHRLRSFGSLLRTRWPTPS